MNFVSVCKHRKNLMMARIDYLLTQCCISGKVNLYFYDTYQLGKNHHFILFFIGQSVFNLFFDILDGIPKRIVMLELVSFLSIHHGSW